MATATNQDCTSLGHDLHAAIGGIGQTDLFQHVQRGLVDAFHFCVGQRIVGAAGKARAKGANIFGQRGSTKSVARPSVTDEW